MTLYATYSFYTTTYKGSMPEEDFNKRILDATAEIRSNTLGKLDGVSEKNIPEEVKLCACILADKMFEDNKNRGKQSETVGPHSISFKGQEEQAKEYKGVIKKHLINVFLDDGTYLLDRGL